MCCGGLPGRAAADSVCCNRLVPNGGVGCGGCALHRADEAPWCTAVAVGRAAGCRLRTAFRSGGRETATEALSSGAAHGGRGRGGSPGFAARLRGKTGARGLGSGLSAKNWRVKAMLVDTGMASASTPVSRRRAGRAHSGSTPCARQVSGFARTLVSAVHGRIRKCARFCF